MKNRIDAIDCWRGFALLTIFIDHMPCGVLARVTYHNFGFSDAAEAFVFLSGVSVALAYAPRLLNGSIAAGFRAVARRLLTIYAVQILLSFLSLGVLVAVALLKDDNVIEPAEHIVLANPGRSVLAILCLALQIDFSNILPLYVILLSLAPAFILLAQVDERLMLGASTAMYLVARAFSLNMPNWPTGDGWFFNPFTFQLLFTIGMFVGLRLQANGSFKNPAPYNRLLFAACIALLSVSAVIVTDGVGLVAGLSDRVHGLLDDDKRVLGTARLVHFLAVAYVVHYGGLTQVLRRTLAFVPLSLIGRHSLPVFATGAFLASVSMATMDDDWPGVPYTLLVVVGGLAAHYLVASYVSGRMRTRSALATTAAIQPATS